MNEKESKVDAQHTAPHDYEWVGLYFLLLCFVLLPTRGRALYNPYLQCQSR